MTIDTSSIKDLKKDFEPLMISFNGCNYNTSVEAKMFTYSGDTIFNIENLRSLFPEESIIGEMHQVNFEKAKEKIRESLSFYAAEGGLVLTSKDNALVHYREKAFWMIVKEYFPYDPNIVYEHIPYSGSYFDYAVMWFFCYVFLKDGKGIVLSAGAYD